VEPLLLLELDRSSGTRFKRVANIEVDVAADEGGGGEIEAATGFSSSTKVKA